jgi:hypothetical protein
VDDPPVVGLVAAPRLVDPWADRRHGARDRHPERLPLLDLPEPGPRLSSTLPPGNLGRSSRIFLDKAVGDEYGLSVAW